MWLTESAPVVVSRARWQDSGEPAFVDDDAPMGTHVYTVIGVDLFGRSGPPAATAPIPVADQARPPPPVRLAATITEAPNQVAVSFEYPTRLARAAPDAQEFRIYVRHDGLTDRRAVVATPASRVTIGGRHAVTVAVHDPAGAAFAPGELARFVGGHLVPARDGPPDPAAARRRFVIAGVTGGPPANRSCDRRAPGR